MCGICSLLQVHHALCEMLTAILAPLICSNQPQSCSGLSAPLLADWYNTVLQLKNEVGQWVNKHSKHTNVGASVAVTSHQGCLLNGSLLAPCVAGQAIPCSSTSSVATEAP